MVKRRLERIVLNSEPFSFDDLFRPPPFPDQKSDGVKKPPSGFTLPAKVVLRAAAVREKLRGLLLDRHRSAGANSRRYSFLFQNLPAGGSHTPIGEFVRGEYTLPAKPCAAKEGEKDPSRRRSGVYDSDSDMDTSAGPSRRESSNDKSPAARDALTAVGEDDRGDASPMFPPLGKTSPGPPGGDKRGSNATASPPGLARGQSTRITTDKRDSVKLPAPLDRRQSNAQLVSVRSANTSTKDSPGPGPLASARRESKDSQGAGGLTSRRQSSVSGPMDGSGSSLRMSQKGGNGAGPGPGSIRRRESSSGFESQGEGNDANGKGDGKSAGSGSGTSVRKPPKIKPLESLNETKASTGLSAHSSGGGGGKDVSRSQVRCVSI